MECGNEEIKRTPKIYHPVNIYKILQLNLTINQIPQQTEI